MTQDLYEKYINNMKDFHDEAYLTLLDLKESYYLNEPQITDEAFDMFEDAFRKEYPNDKYFSIVGTNVKGSSNIKHRTPMLSCGKAKTVDEVEKWLEKINLTNTQVCVSPKYDGLSFTAKYENGKLQYLATRGNGIEGEAFTDKAQYISDAKLVIDYTESLEVRGEIIIKKEFQSKFTGPLRNSCVGLIKRKDFSDLFQYITLVYYNVVGLDFGKEEDKFHFLQKLNFNTSEFTCFKSDAVAKIYKDWQLKRDQYTYEIDGLVITLNNTTDQKQNEGTSEHHHNYQIALKFQSEIKESTLIDIFWDISRNGNLCPIAIIEPITILGRQISRASLSNYENVIRLGLEKGDTVLISLSNDVIPYVEENVTKGIKQR